jgi:hypothetical protein
MSPDNRDRELSRLYQHSGARGSPPELDRRILETANRLAPARRAWYRHNWMPALSATVVVGLALTLAIPLGDDPGVLPTAAPPAREESPELMPEDGLFETLENSSVMELDDDALIINERSRPPGELKSLRRAARKEAPAAVQRDQATLAAGPAEAGVQDRDPRSWLAEITRLLDEGQQRAALREFQQFRQHYPGFEVEAVLQERLAAAAELD